MIEPVAYNKPEEGRTVAASINAMIAHYREHVRGDRAVSIATAYINPAGFMLLKDELEHSQRVRLLIGAEPEFDADRAISENQNDAEAKWQSALSNHDNWLAAERDLAGFTLDAVRSAQAMVEWLEQNSDGSKTVEVRRFPEGFLHGKTFMVETAMGAAAISGSSNFTFAGLTKNAELNLFTFGHPGHVKDIGDWFDYYWQKSLPYDLASLYKEQWQPHSPWDVFMRMLFEMYGETYLEEGAAEAKLGLTEFQRDGVARMRRLLEQHGGVLVADEVGLGKSFLAGEMIKTATEVNRQRAVIICPAAIKSSMWEPFLDRHIESRHVKVYSYDEVRNRLKMPQDPGPQASRAEKAKYAEDLASQREFEAEMGDYALVVVDEAHNLRNSAAARSEALDRVILAGSHPKQVVLLTATPVNNSLSDLETLVKYFIRDDAKFANIGIPSIRAYIKRAQDMDPENLTPEHLFDLMDQVAVRRTRKFVKDNYPGDTVIDRFGKKQTIQFPTPKSYRIDYNLDSKGTALVDSMLYALDTPDLHDNSSIYQARKSDDNKLMLARYQPSAYLKTGALLTQQVTNAGLLRSALLKRLESSPSAIHKTLVKLVRAHEAFLKAMLDHGQVIVGGSLAELTNSNADDFDEILASFDDRNSKDIESLDNYRSYELIEDVRTDLDLLKRLVTLAEAAKAQEDAKFLKLLDAIGNVVESAEKIEVTTASPRDRRKVLVFSTYADTIVDLQSRFLEAVNSGKYPKLDVYRERIAPPILGAYASTQEAGDAGGVDQRGRANVLAGFAPKTAGDIRDNKVVSEDRFDILFTTDVLAEGVNLQQCANIVNYDLPWNPMRIVQRHGRIDRIGSEHNYVYLGLFFPEEKLDAMLRLEEVLQRKLAQARAAVGEHIEVLAQAAEVAEVILHDKSMEKMNAFLEARGGEAAISGEEFRRRMMREFMHGQARDKIQGLPFGSGSGFVNPKMKQPGYVFCVKVAGHDKPWFRFVQTTDKWQVALDQNTAKPLISSESLVSLVAADPVRSDQVRVLSDEAYSGVFDAWQVAQAHIHQEWNKLADVKNVAVQAPKAFRDAFNLVMDHGIHLGGEIQDNLASRLNTVPSRAVESEVRQVLNSGLSKKDQIDAIKTILDESGIVVPPPAKPLPAVNENEVRLVAWMAVSTVPEPEKAKA